MLIVIFDTFSFSSFFRHPTVNACHCSILYVPQQVRGDRRTNEYKKQNKKLSSQARAFQKIKFRSWVIDRVAPLEQRTLIPAVLVETLVIIVLVFLSDVVVDSPTGRRSSALRLAVHEVLGKHTQIEEKSNETASEPAQVDEDVFAVNMTSLAGSAFIVLALRFVGEDGQDISNVSETCKKEEEHAESVGCLAPPVQDELGETRSDVCDGAEISKDLTRKTEVKAILASSIVVAMLVASRSFLTQEPANNTSCNDHQDDDGVPNHSLKDSRGLRSGIFGDVRNSW